MNLAPEAERTILGAVLLDNATLPGVAQRLLPIHFGKPSHQRIYGAMLAMFDRTEAIDLVTLRHELGGDLPTVGGATYLGGLVEGLPRVSSLEQWSGIVLDAARRRAALALGARLSEILADEDADVVETLERHQASIGKLLEDRGRGVVAIAEVLPQVMADLDEFMAAPEGVMGIPTDLPDLDKLTGGWRPGTLTVIGALPGRGKSVFCKQAAVAAAKRGHRVLFFGMEMEPREIAGRMLMAEAGVDKWHLRNRPELWDDVLRAHTRLSPLPIHFDPRESLTIGQIRATAKQQATKGLSLVIVDYLQRCALDARLDQWQAIGDIAKGLKSMARSLKVPVIAACQLRAEADGREPTMADFAQARQVIAAEADLIGLLHPKDGESWRDQAAPMFRLIVPKQRNGATSTGLALRFEKATSRFVCEYQEAIWQGAS